MGKWNTPGSEKQPLSAIQYLIISIIVLIFAIVLFISFIFLQKNNSSSEINIIFFYIIFILLALFCAAFLFGVMKTYARYRGKVNSGILELGGPIVVFIIVLIIGIKFTINYNGNDITNGILFIEILDQNDKPVEGATVSINKFNKSENTDKNGKTNFNLLKKYKNQTVLIKVEKDGYQQNGYEKIDIISTDENITKSIHITKIPSFYKIKIAIKSAKVKEVLDKGKSVELCWEINAITPDKNIITLSSREYDNAMRAGFGNKKYFIKNNTQKFSTLEWNKELGSKFSIKVEITDRDDRYKNQGEDANFNEKGDDDIDDELVEEIKYDIEEIGSEINMPLTISHGAEILIKYSIIKEE